LETPLQNVDGRIVIPIQDQPAVGAGMRTFAQRLWYDRTAGGTHFGGVAGVHQHDSSPSFFRFGDGHGDKLAPRHIQHALAHPTAAPHLHWSEGFKDNRLIAVDQFPAALVRKISAAVGDPLVNMGQRPFAATVRIPSLRVFGRILQRLNTFQVGLITPVEARVGDLRPISTMGVRLLGAATPSASDAAIAPPPEPAIRLSEPQPLPVSATGLSMAHVACHCANPVSRLHWVGAMVLRNERPSYRTRYTAASLAGEVARVGHPNVGNRHYSSDSRGTTRFSWCTKAPIHGEALSRKAPMQGSVHAPHVERRPRG
jgi:hypothetical protein